MTMKISFINFVFIDGATTFIYMSTQFNISSISVFKYYDNLLKYNKS